MLIPARRLAPCRVDVLVCNDGLEERILRAKSGRPVRFQGPAGVEWYRPGLLDFRARSVGRVDWMELSVSAPAHYGPFSRLLHGFPERAQLPASALSRPIQSVVPPAALGNGELVHKTIFGMRSAGRRCHAQTRYEECGDK